MISWMKSEAYRAINVYGQAEVGSLTLQAEYARADHEAERDPGAVLEILAHGAANEGQRQRFLLDPTGPEMESNVRLVGDYVAESLYLRAGRSFRTSLGELAPYVLWDWYRNPELVADEDLGGDGEAGASDDGSFHKPTLGLVVRPIPTVAIKLDWSQHRYTLSGESVSYSELFLDVSFAFGF